MKQIILTVEDNSLIPKLKAAVKLLHGVINVKVVNVDSKEKANKETLEAINELRRGDYAGKLDNSSKEELLKSLMML
ncbi:hypothetical protein E5358_00845 [Palleniella muris]|uniref:Uncharacterized protein n=1 Tax=Palleniella muris TaxID=3038145 RepID=A0AC61QU23_9BACT|nr:hypothetical protein [Palleniella muris]TGX84217.1 hypothetical protein E5358_00845 [Palleniella muris]